MNFIGRKKELFEINKAFKSDVKEFIAITGKRGIGKTELSTYAINNFCLKLEKNNEILKQKKEIKVFKLRGRNKTSTLDQILDAEVYFNDFFH